MVDIQDYNLLNNNTFGIEETCRRYISFDTVDELRNVLLSLLPSDHPILILGGGSNLLLTRRFEGTVLHSAICGMDVTDCGDDVLLRCGSGERWDDVVEYAVSNGWHGAENLSIIPGDVGASAVQNIGAYGAEAKDIIECVEALDIETAESRKFTAEDCDYAYRYSRFKGEWKGRYVITHVTYRLQKAYSPRLDYGNIQSELDKRGIANPTARDVRNLIIEIRNAKLPDPKVEGNAGSFFMNPVVDKQIFDRLVQEYPEMPYYPVDANNVKIPAGWLIDRCGWKGRSLGRAGIHSKQALVIVNKGGARGSDIVALSEAVRQDVKGKFGIDIYPEVNFV
ncbi:MAG: UDP-N-acetylmuramate dehydrogenase [Prevotella sp.]|nr:UDP-N-acetylmuramate dehydrogenase [Prevotella sp.]